MIDDYLGQRVIRDDFRRRPISNDNETKPTYAGLIVRFLARAFDFSVYSIIVAIACLVSNDLIGFILACFLPLIFFFIVNPCLVKSKFKGSLGKIIFGLTLERSNGETLGYFRILLREVIFCSLFFMSFIIPFTTEKTGVHDLIFDTRVRKKDISKKLFFPATILTIALYVLNSHLYTLAEDHIDSYISSELTKIDETDISQLTNKLSTFEKKVNNTNVPETEIIPNVLPPAPLTNEQIGVMRVGDSSVNYKDVFVKVVDIHNQGLKQKIAPSNYELQIALYDKVLSTQEKEHLKKVNNLIMATKNAAMTFAIQLANIENGCLESNFRNAKIQIKKGANDFSLAFTSYNFFKKGRLSITCTDFNKETPLTFSLRNTFYRSHDREVKLNLKFTTMIE